MARPPIDEPKGVQPLVREHPDAVTQLLASVVESSDDAIVTKNLDGIITSWNRGAERVFGYTAEEAIGQPVTMLIPANRLDEEPAILSRIRRGERIDHYETVRQRKHGSLIDVSVTVSPIRNDQGKIVGASKVARDITDRKRAHDRQQLLMRELEHRTKNLFAVIQSVANRSLVEPYTLAQAKEVLDGRLHALAQAHTVLADSAWQGAPLSKIVERELAGFPDQSTISGCDLVVNTPAAQQFGLAVHELTTNAVKYGALSVATGRVLIEGGIEGPNAHATFSFLWKEIGGPAVVPPVRKGFGSTILLDLAKQFGPHVALSYKPDGVVYEVRYPLSTIEQRPYLEGRGRELQATPPYTLRRTSK